MTRGIALRLSYEVIVRDKNGKVLSREKRTSKSLVTNFARWLRAFFCVFGTDQNAPTWTMNDTTNIGRTVPYQGLDHISDFGGMKGTSNNSDLGMMVGTSNQAVTPADYNLVGKIGQGTGAGQMVYGDESYEAIVVEGSVSRFRSTRTFTNNSGSLITVKEIGFVFHMKDTAAASRNFLGCRDVLGTPKDVPDGSTITVRYTKSVSA